MWTLTLILFLWFLCYRKLQQKNNSSNIDSNITEPLLFLLPRLKFQGRFGQRARARPRYARPQSVRGMKKATHVMWLIPRQRKEWGTITEARTASSIPTVDSLSSDNRRHERFTAARWEIHPSEGKAVKTRRTSSLPGIQMAAGLEARMVKRMRIQVQQASQDGIKRNPAARGGTDVNLPVASLAACSKLQVRWSSKVTSLPTWTPGAARSAGRIVRMRQESCRAFLLCVCSPFSSDV